MDKKVFVSNDFQGHYPVGTAAVVLADSEEEAREYLENALQQRGLKSNEYTMRELTGYGAYVLCDGNY